MLKPYSRRFLDRDRAMWVVENLLCIIAKCHSSFIEADVLCPTTLDHSDYQSLPHPPQSPMGLLWF